MTLDDLLQHIPYLRAHFFDHALGALDIVRIVLLHELFHHKRLEKLQGHLLWQAALVHLQLGADDDDASARVVHTLAQQILAEAPLFACLLYTSRCV